MDLENLITRIKLKTARAYQLRLTSQGFWNLPKEDAEAFLRKWFFGATPAIATCYDLSGSW